MTHACTPVGCSFHAHVGLCDDGRLMTEDKHMASSDAVFLGLHCGTARGTGPAAQVTQQTFLAIMGKLAQRVGLLDPATECLTTTTVCCKSVGLARACGTMSRPHLLSSLYVTNLTAEFGTILMQLVPFPLNHSLNPPVLVMCMNPWMYPSQASD